MNIIAAILPVIIIGIYIYKKDKNKEPTGLLIKLFIGGIASTIITIVLGLILELFLPNLVADNLAKLNTLELIIYAFISVGLVEELSKWIMTYIISYNNKEFDEIYDIIVYSVFVSLGFAALENILYVMDKGMITAVTRGIFSVPGHTCVGIYMGYYLGLAKIDEVKNNGKSKNKNLLLSIIVPSFLHGVFDYCLFKSSITYLIIFLLFVIILFLYAKDKVEEFANMKMNLNTLSPDQANSTPTNIIPNQANSTSNNIIPNQVNSTPNNIISNQVNSTPNNIIPNLVPISPSNNISETIKCPYCNNIIAKNNYCPNCGKKIE